MAQTTASIRTSLRSVNLNLLPILATLLSTRSVSATAEELHMSQSAVSDALARLRHQFRDELMLRSGREMTLTPFARQLRAPVRDIIERLELLVDTPAVDPALLTREFVVATADPVVMTIGGMLCRFLQAHAPLCSVRFVDIQNNDYQRLRDMELDLVIVVRGFLRTEQLQEAVVYTEEFVCIARRDHPAIRSKLTRQLYEQLPHASFRADQETPFGMESKLTQLNQFDSIKVPSFSMLPFIVEQSDAVAFVQRRVAERFAQTANIQILHPPISIPPLQVCMYWGPGQARDRAHQWFRESLRTLTRDLD